MAKKRALPPRPRLRRTHRLTLTLNEREYKAIIDHCESRRIASRTSWMREVIMAEVFTEHERNAPFLFDEAEMQ